MIEITTLELFIIAYHHALGEPEPPWSDLDDPQHRKHVDAALYAVKMLPPRFFFSVPGHGDCFEVLDDVKSSLSEEQRFADRERGNGE